VLGHALELASRLFVRFQGEQLRERLRERRRGRRFDDDRLRILSLVPEFVQLVLRFLLARVLLSHTTPVDHNVEDVRHALLAVPLPRRTAAASC
jgi:hypothetical protein